MKCTEATLTPLCETCKKNKSIGVACVPGVPYSAAYCQECLEANAHPWGVLVANTACLGGWEEAADWWKDMVLATCKHLNKTLDEFKAAVEEDKRAFREA